MIRRRYPLNDVREVILDMFKQGRPLLIGDVSMKLRCSLREAEILLEDLVRENEVRLLSESEAKDHGVAWAYVRASNRPKNS